MRKTIVVGVGNPILGDDGVGIHVVRMLRRRVKNRGVFFEEALTGGMNLVDLILGYDKAVVVDAVAGEEKGLVKRFSLSDFETVHSLNPHGMSFLEAIDLAKKMGENRLPSEIVVVGVTISESSSFKEELSREVADAVPRAVEMVLSELRK
ncbi:MAG TPA: hydrogenase maturation protease [Thermoplasmatales archaeon]|nr:hydrogenase maturation protease [Thermoplasmatales archaeon]